MFNSLKGASTVALLVLSIFTYVGSKAVAEDTSHKTKETIPGTAGSAETYLSAGAGLTLIDSQLGVAFNVGVLREIGSEQNLFVGADLGLDLFGAPSGFSSTGIQLLPTAIYRFDVTGAKTIFPYIGLSVGPNVVLNKYGGTSTTTVKFEALLRPGMFTRINQSLVLGVEAKLGILSSDFIFLPNASLIFSL